MPWPLHLVSGFLDSSIRARADNAETTAGPLVFIEDVVRLRKPHPCGSYEWTVVRLGADIGLRCHGCEHGCCCPGATFEKRLKTFVSRGPGYEADAGRRRPPTAMQSDPPIAAPDSEPDGPE